MRVEVTPARVHVHSALLSGRREVRVGLSSSPGAKSPAGPTGIDRAPGPLPHLTETESIGTGTRWGCSFTFIDDEI